MASETRDAPCTAAAAAPQTLARPAVEATPASTGQPNANLRSRSRSLARGPRPAPTGPARPASGGAVAPARAVTADISRVVANSTAEQSTAGLRRAAAPQIPERTRAA